MSGLYDVIASRYGDPSAFVRRLKSTMLLHGITQGQLARRSGYDPRQIRRWLAGQHKPGMTAMVTLEEAVDALLDTKGVPGVAA